MHKASRPRGGSQAPTHPPDVLAAGLCRQVPSLRGVKATVNPCQRAVTRAAELLAGRKAAQAALAADDDLGILRDPGLDLGAMKEGARVNRRTGLPPTLVAEGAGIARPLRARRRRCMRPPHVQARACPADSAPLP
jgi:hypothetical protein